MSRKRISRLMTLQEKRMEIEQERKEQQMKDAERKAKAEAAHANRGGRGAQRIPL